MILSRIQSIVSDNNMKNLSLLFCLFLLTFTSLKSQTNEYKVACIGFYNLENLFDYENDTLKNDEEYLPDGENAWTKERYEEKIANMAFVISKIGTDLTPYGASILGVSEIENRRVLEDLVKHPLIKSRNYQIVHFDSPDRRGVDVGMIYNPDHFKPLVSTSIPFDYVKEDGDSLITRDILYVSGKLDDEIIHLMVNHWPSRRGGEETTAKFRNRGAEICNNYIDSLIKMDVNAKVFVMGDMNDNPDNESVRSIIPAKADREELNEGDVYNPMYNKFKKGLGSNAYRDNWSLFDQILVTEEVTNKDQDGYFLYKTEIFKENFMIRRKGQYKGYPKRTFGGDEYLGGYSDHFPVYVYLTKKIK